MATTYTITVQSTVDGNKYFVDGVQQDSLMLEAGQTYVFDQTDVSNSGHPLALSRTDDGTHGGGVAYTNGIVVTGTAGTDRVLTFTAPNNAPSSLYYYCQVHSGMGGSITVQNQTDNDPIRNFFKTLIVGEYSTTDTSLDVISTDAPLLPDPAVSGSYNLTIFSGTDSAISESFEIVRVTAKSNDTLTVVRAQEGTTALDMQDPNHVFGVVYSATKKTFDDIKAEIDQLQLDVSNIELADQDLNTTDDVEFNTVTASSFSGDGSALTGIATGATVNERVAIMDLMTRQAEDDFDNTRTEIDFYGGFYDVFVDTSKIETELDNILSDTSISGFNNPGGFCFADSGSKFFINTQSTDHPIVAYNLSTPYDLSTATLVATVNFASDIASLYSYLDSNRLSCVLIVEGGTNGLIMNNQRSHIVSFELSTPYDLTTKTNFKGINPYSDVDGGQPTGITMSDDGNYFYSQRSGTIRRIPMGTPYDITTLSSSADKAGGISSDDGIAISNDGTALIAHQTDGYRIYKMSVPFDVSTMTLIGSDTSASGTSTQSLSVDINDNHRQFFIQNYNADAMIVKTVSTAYNPEDIVDPTDNLTVSAGAGGTVSHISGLGLNEATVTDNSITETRSSTSDRYWQFASWSESGDYIYALYQNDRNFVKYPRQSSTPFDPAGLQWNNPTEQTGNDFRVDGSIATVFVMTPTRLYAIPNNNSKNAVYWEDASGNGDFPISTTPTDSGFNFFASMNQVKEDCINAWPWFDNGNKWIRARNDSGFGDSFEIWQTSTPYQFEGSSVLVSPTKMLSNADILKYPCFNKDGTKIICSSEDNDLEQYTFSTPFDITTQIGTQDTHDLNYAHGGFTAYIQSNPSNANKFFVLERDNLTLYWQEYAIENPDTDGTFQATPIDLSDAITGSPSAVVMTADGTDVEGNFSVSLSDGTNTVVVSTLDTEVDVSALSSTTLTATVEISNGAIIKSYALYFK